MRHPEGNIHLSKRMGGGVSGLQKRQECTGSECTGSECTRVWRGATVWDGRTRDLIKKQRGAKGMAEWLKILGLRNLSLIPGTHMVKQETQLHVCPLMSTCVL